MTRAMPLHLLATTSHMCVQEASQQYASSLEELPEATLALLGVSGGGSRALQAFLEGHSTPKAKKRLIRKLLGSYAALAETPGGSFLTEASYAAGVRPCLHCMMAQRGACRVRSRQMLLIESSALRTLPDVPCSFALQSRYSRADLLLGVQSAKQKESIVLELAAAAEALNSSARGAKLLTR